MSKKGKALEQLVKSIEEQIKENPSLRVRSNVKIPNSNGILREFDVVVDNTSADSSGIIVYECKDHKAVLDIQYVDSFYGKCSNVSNIARKVLVSPSGFSENAILEAKSKGIELLKISDIQNKENAPKYDISLCGLSYSVLPGILFFTLDGDSTIYNFLDQGVKEIKNDSGLDFYHALSSLLEQNGDLFQKQFVETLYQAHTEQMDILSFIQEPFTIVTDSEQLRVSSMGWCFHVEAHFVQPDMVAQKQYGDPETVISEFELKGTGVKTTLIRGSNSMKMYYNDTPFLEPLDDM